EPAQADDGNSHGFHIGAALFHVSDEFLETHFAVFIGVHPDEAAVGSIELGASAQAPRISAAASGYTANFIVSFCGRMIISSDSRRSMCNRLHIAPIVIDGRIRARQIREVSKIYAAKLPRPCGVAKSIIGPLGTMPRGLRSSLIE
ncbi:MAG: hypothetical protein QF767_14970, partial [Alphaproteobacteria bacterium]|nr:hypothetical protein [Alphaproteobacteria bacterium]